MKWEELREKKTQTEKERGRRKKETKKGKGLDELTQKERKLNEKEETAWKERMQ